ncbi:hypothetical protein DL98DRAFT_613778 [Cadophora sp. DSE1049]|nr:hypothetical protein DL98DRAFT_613778 [Cadophora sp. DSE1049]
MTTLIDLFIDLLFPNGATFFLVLEGKSDFGYQLSLSCSVLRNFMSMDERDFVFHRSHEFLALNEAVVGKCLSHDIVFGSALRSHFPQNRNLQLKQNIKHGQEPVASYLLSTSSTGPTSSFSSSKDFHSYTTLTKIYFRFQHFYAASTSTAMPRVLSTFRPQHGLRCHFIVPVALGIIMIAGWGFICATSDSISSFQALLGLVLINLLTVSGIAADTPLALQNQQDPRIAAAVETLERRKGVRAGQITVLTKKNTFPPFSPTMGRGMAPSPPMATVYPLPQGISPINDPKNVALRHQGFLCRAVQSFVGNRELNERDVMTGELLLVLMSKPGWLFVCNHESQGGKGWVPTIYLERYNPEDDPSVYYDKRFSADKTPLYIYNPFARPPNDEATILRLAELLRPLCAAGDFSGYQGLYEVGIKNLEATDISTFPDFFEGWPVVYREKVEMRCPCHEVDTRTPEEREAAYKEKWKDAVCTYCKEVGHRKYDCKVYHKSLGLKSA